MANEAHAERKETAVKVAKTVGILSIIAGIIMIVAGAVTWGVVTTQLKAEKITVPADASIAAGQEVGGPITAYAQAQIINEHAMKATNGLTYAELGAKVKEAQTAGDTAAADEFQQQRNTVMNASFLRASLFTSVVSYGVAALVIGLGLLSVLLGWGFLSIPRPAPARVGTVN